MKHQSKKMADTFQQLLIQYLPRLRRFALSLSRDGETADDLVQHVCEKALMKQEQYRINSRMDSWLYRILYTKWIDLTRRRTTRSSKLNFLKRTESIDSASSNIANVEAKMDIQTALSMLKPEQRAVILLVLVEGHSYIEAGTILNVPPGTVASRVARAREQLMDTLAGSKQVASLLETKEKGEEHEYAGRSI